MNYELSSVEIPEKMRCLEIKVILVIYFYLETGTDCIRYPISIQLFGMVYGSFILLFGKLFYDSVIKAGRRQRQARLKLTKEQEKKQSTKPQEEDINCNKIKAA